METFPTNEKKKPFPYLVSMIVFFAYLRNFFFWNKLIFKIKLINPIYVILRTFRQVKTIDTPFCWWQSVNQIALRKKTKNLRKKISIELKNCCKQNLKLTFVEINVRTPMGSVF